MPPRFFAPDLTSSSPDVILPEGESTHLTRVLRLAPGALVEVFDGRGVVRAGVVERASAQTSVVRLGEPLPAVAEPDAPLAVAVSLLKGDAMDAVVRDATVLGAREIWPMRAMRSNVPPRAAQAAQERWQRVAIAAAKQCGRAVLPTIAPVRPLTDVIADTRVEFPVRLWLTEPAAASGEGADVPVPPRGLCLAVGPEGGWTTEEVEAARAAGWSAWTLAPVTLRAEHVVLAALSVVRYAWDAARRRRIT